MLILVNDLKGKTMESVLAYTSSYGENKNAD